VRSRLESLRKTVVRLREASRSLRQISIETRPFSGLNSASSWRGKQSRGELFDEGLECQSPKGCLKLALKLGWLAEETSWLEMLEDRNQTSHTYDEEVAKRVYSRLAGYVLLLEHLLLKLKD
jgi:nucleotidyltransferase-like protein